MPWLVNKCYMEEVEREYSSEFYTVRVHDSSRFSATCVYDSWINGHMRASKSYDP